MYYDANFAHLLFTSAQLTGTSFTPTQAQWNAILGDDDNTINVVVTGGNSASPATGPYTSCNRQLVQPK